ncbi:hypothetical protein [Parasphingorhabdus sp.]|uniref:hypothetical protein n=1 Tax=Parasphingorhabdus sp. TaxID=2709688 RepID=UPI003A91CC6C
MTQPLSMRQPALSYITAPRYAAGMLDSPLSRSPQAALPEVYTKRLLAAAKTAFFCGLRPKFTENKKTLLCKAGKGKI